MGVAAALWAATMTAALSQQQPPVFHGTLDQHPVIDYRGGVLNDAVTVVRRDIEAGKTTLAFDGTQGFLRSLLGALDVPVESQLLLFSKTGIQLAFTSPETPRALYFNDRVIVGYIPGAPVIEMASHDPRQGIVFQTLVQSAATPHQFARPDRCLSCHLSANSMEVSPLEQRWGGWYVTGTHGAARHMGNAMITGAMKPESAIGAGTHNRSTLHDRVDLSAYPKNTSDISALNLLTRLGWEARVAAAEGRAYFSKGELRALAWEVAGYLALSDEVTLTAPVQGASGFPATFAAAGPRDRKGRSLRDLDLQTRLFKYRCSYMIYSPAFDALLPLAKSAVLARMRETITDQATIEILADTKAGWR